MSARMVLLGVALVVCVAGVAAGCSGNGGGSRQNQGADSRDDDERDAGAQNLPAPEIISRSRGSLGTLGVQGQPGQTVLPALPGITVRQSIRERLPADEAFAIALFLPRTGGSAHLPAADEATLRGALAAAGFADDDVGVEASPQFGPFTQIRVRIPVADVAASAERVFAAITNSIGAPEQRGVQFALQDCSVALRPVREAAIEAAEERARSLSAAGSLSTGDVIAVLELPSATPYGGPVDDPCDPGAGLQFKGYGALLPVDSEPEVEVALDFSVTYRIAESGEPPQTGSKGVVALGAGTVTAKADEAYIVVLTESSSGPSGPRPVAERDKDEIIQLLSAFGIAAEDIEFYSPQFGGPTVVSVETDDLSNLADLGDDVADAVEEVLGRSFNNGVIFSHSNCEAARSEARKEAIEDARARAESLAGAASLKLAGAVDSVSEVQAQSIYGPAPIDPCEEDLSVIALGGYGTAEIKPFTAEAEFTVRSVLNVAFAVE
jgi:uncharacterized protein YggE